VITLQRLLTFADFLADGDKSLAFVMVLDLFFDWFLVAAAGELGVQLFLGENFMIRRVNFWD
jgi:hypothetical protein